MEEKYLFRMGPQGQCNESCPIKPEIGIGSYRCTHQCGNCKENDCGQVGDKTGCWVICDELNEHRTNERKEQ